MALIKNPLSGGGSGGGGGLIEITNGIIEQYKAQAGTVDVNTFVEFVDASTLEYANTYTGVGGTEATAVKINDSQALMAFSGGTYPYVRVLTFQDEEIIFGTSTQLATVDDGYGVSLTILDDNKVIALYGLDTLYARVCIIEEGTDSISFGTQTSISTKNSGRQSMAAQVETDKVVLTYHYQKDVYTEPGATTPTAQYYTRVMAATVSGTTISKGTAVETGNNSPSAVHVAAVDSATLIGTERYYGAVWQLSGTTLTKGTQTSIGDSVYSTGSVKYIGNGFVLRFRAVSDDLCMQVLSAVQNTLAVSASPIPIAAAPSGKVRVGAAPLGESKALVIRSGFTNHTTDLAGYIVQVNSLNDAQVLITSQLTQLYPSDDLNVGYTLVIMGDRVAIPAVWSALVEAELTDSKLVVPASSTIQGLTRTVVTDQSVGDVWVLDTSQSE